MKTAAQRRTALAIAAAQWIAAQAADPTNEEADIALEAVLNANSVISDDDAIHEIYSDAPETLMVRVNGNTLIEIDVASGNYARGEADE